MTENKVEYMLTGLVILAVIIAVVYLVLRHGPSQSAPHIYTPPVMPTATPK